MPKSIGKQILYRLLGAIIFFPGVLLAIFSVSEFAKGNIQIKEILMLLAALPFLIFGFYFLNKSYRV